MDSENKKLVCGSHLIGRGRFGAVYDGTLDDQPVVVKKVRLADVQIEKENISMQQLQHVNVIKLLHVEDDDEFRNFVLERCTASLDDYCKGNYNGKMPSELECLLDMAEGLNHIHSKLLVHGDIKPENVLISLPDCNGEVHLKISDFGLFRTSDSQDQSLEHGEVSHVNDILALGCTFYFYLSKGTRLLNIDGQYDLTELGQSCYLPLITQLILLEQNERPTTAQVLDQLNQIQTLQAFKENEAESEEEPDEVAEVPQLQPARHDQQHFSMKTVEVMTSRSGGDEYVGRVNHCQFHPTKLQFCCALDAGVICVVTASNQTDWKKTFISSGTSLAFYRLGWNADGSQLAAGCRAGTVVVWSEDGELCLEEREHSAPIRCLRWNPESRHLLATGDSSGKTIVWDCNSRRAIQEFKFHSDCVNDICWISANAYASGSSDGFVFVSEVGQSTPVEAFYQGDCVWRVIWNSQDRELIAGSSRSLKIYKRGEQHPLFVLKQSNSPCTACCLALCGRKENAPPMIALGFGLTVSIWDLESKELDPIVELKTDGPGVSGDEIWSLEFSENGKFLATLSRWGHLLIWETQNWDLSCSTELPSNLYLDSISWDSGSNALAIPCCSSSATVMTVVSSELAPPPVEDCSSNT